MRDARGKRGSAVRIYYDWTLSVMIMAFFSLLPLAVELGWDLEV